MDFKPRVSIIVPIYNAEKYLNQCIGSLISQSYQNLEIILVNDGSTDNSGKICDYYEEKDTRIKVIHQQNRGLSEARNKGTVNCTGDYLMYVDADDWLDNETCISVIDATLKYSADIVMWGHKKEYLYGRSKENRPLNTNKVFNEKNKTWLLRRLIGLVGKELSSPTKTDAFSSAWGKLYKKDLIINNKIQFLDTYEIGSEDVLFNIEAFYRAKVIVYLDALFYHYLQDNPKAITKSHKSTLFPRFMKLFEHIKSFLIDNKLSQEFYIALENRIALSIINNSLSITSKGNHENLGKKIKSIKGILQNEVYRTALMRLETKYLPFYWKIFFLLCKLEFAPGVLFLAYIMRMLR